jgi:hypothetical protein
MTEPEGVQPSGASAALPGEALGDRRRAMVKVRPGAVARGVGVALACLASTPRGRSRVLFAAYALG